MDKMPRIVKIGGALGFIGGVISIICMAMFFDIDESALTVMGAYLLIAVMFFALAGGFAKTGQWSWSVLMLMTFLTVGVVGAAVIFDAVDLYAGIILVIVAALIVASLALPSSKTWANRTRF
jgi:lysylphosphatidylglycerol synthetase-like protein (DUF2156 family)